MSVDTETFWAGSFGVDYTERNQIDWRTREEFWRSAMEYMSPTSVLEVGCNRGHNLMAIQAVDSTVETHGIDINAKAVSEARGNGVGAQLGSARNIVQMFSRGSMDLVFTAGVLIHVPPEDLEATMRNIVAVSRKYVLAIEYEAEQEEEVEYRGHTGKLWKRPFGKLYQDMGLNLLAFGDAKGFDRCTFFVLEKP
jgi:pseudaminic acid biosynthesis-associated methylase